MITKVSSGEGKETSAFSYFVGQYSTKTDNLVRPPDARYLPRRHKDIAGTEKQRIGQDGWGRY